MKSYKILFSILLILLCGCTSRAESGASRSDGQISVSIHGVNYTADPFQFSVTDPRDKKNSGGGEHIGPYAAGGTVCCFNLPVKWSPGMTLEIYSKHWLSTGDGKETSAVETKHMVQVPAYVGGKAGELWVLRTPDGSIDVVSSDLQPNHPQWPGEIKGWPVPSRDFMLERWSLERKYAESDIKAHQTLIEELDRSPDSALAEAWEFDKKYSKTEIRDFNGPADPAYRKKLKERYAEGLKSSKSHLEQVMKGKP